MVLFSFLSSCQVGARNVRFATLIPRVASKSISELIEKPKGLVNGYTIFYSEKYPHFKKEFPNFHVTDIAKRIGSLWKSVSEGEKKRYNDRAAEMNKTSKVATINFKKNLSEKQEMALKILRLSRSYARKTISLRDLKPNEREFIASLPKAPYTTGRHIFSSQKLRGKSAASLGDNLYQVGKEWEKLSADQKAQYDKQAAQDLKNYHVALAKFLSS